ncbi:MAG: class II aldolase/adducin family protein [Candidatus Altiarchaeota archaeon]|nr:class II aldolase/adducin family protein [Candidatus Altiarchaeota archaeon]
MDEKYVGRKFTTEFIKKDFERDNEFIRHMITSARMLKAYDLTPDTTGNISIMTCEGMYIKAGGKSLGDLTPDDIVFVVDYKKRENKVIVRGGEEPSSEAPMHWLIYHRFPRASAIVHVHDRVVLENTESVKRNRIKITEKEADYGTLKQADEVLNALLYDDYAVIKNHGSISIGNTIEDATKQVIDVHKKILEDEN